MMRWIVESSLKLRIVMAGLAVLLIIFGFTRLRHGPVDALPEYSRPHVESRAEALGLSAQKVETVITTPLEADLLDEVSWNEREFGEWVSSRAPRRNPVGLCPERGEMLIAVKGFCHGAITLRI